MRITSLHIQGFGIFANTGIAAVPPGLTVLCAANGGGKTTVRDFIRAALFGFPRKGNDYAPLAAGQHGGVIDFTTQGGIAYRLQFDAARRKHSVQRLDGQAAPELTALLGGASYDLYSNIFALGLHELQDAKYLDSDQVRAMIGGFGSGHAGKVFQAVGTALPRDAAALFKPGGQKPSINQLLGAIAADTDELKRLRAEAETYWGIDKELAQLQDHIIDIEALENRLRREHQHLQTLMRAWPEWVVLQQLTADLEVLGPAITEFPDNSLQRLERIIEARQARAEELAAQTHELERQREAVAALPVDDALLGHATDIEDAWSGLALHHDACRQLEEAGVTRRRDETVLAEELGRLGNWLPERVQAFDDSVAGIAEKNEASRALNQALQAVELARENAEQAARVMNASRHARETAESAFGAQWPTVPPPEDKLDEDSQRVQRARAKLAEIARLNERVLQWNRETADAHARIAALEARLREPVAPVARSPLRTVAWCCLAGGLVLAGLAYQTPLIAGAALLLGVVLFVICWHLGGAPVIDTATRYFEDELETWRQKATSAGQAAAAETVAIREAESEVNDWFGRCITEAECDNIAGRLRQAREARRQWEQGAREVADLKGRYDEAALRYQAAEEEVARRSRNLETAIGRWQAWLAARQLPPGLSPEAAQACCVQVEKARRQMRQLEVVAEQQQRLQQQVEDYRAKIAGLFESIGRSEPDTNELPGALRELREQRDAARANRLRRDEFEAALPARAELRARLSAQIETLDRAQSELFAAGNVVARDEFVARATQWETQCELQARIKAQHGKLELLTAPGDPVMRLRAELAKHTHEELCEMVAASSRDLEAAIAELATLQRRHGEGTSTQRKLAASDDVATNTQELEDKLSELRELAEEWAVLKLGAWLMEKARRKYEVERQPAVLQSAGNYLGIISGGRYTRIVQPIGSERYQLMHADGSTKDNEATWNTALKEMTYLALRFGLIEAYSKQSEPLPIILDDALVNLDPRHLDGAVACIADLAQRHQVFYLTCHPHTLDRFAGLGTPPALFKIKDGSFRPGDFAAPTL